MIDWWTNAANMADLACYLMRRGASEFDIRYAFSKPWKWTPEYEAGFQD